MNADARSGPATIRFEFATSGRVIFEAGALDGVGPLTRELGRRALIVTGRDPNRARPLTEKLAAAGMTTSTFSLNYEPTTDDIRRAIAQARADGSEVVIGFGGGAAIDAAKATAALLTNEGDLLAYLEVIGGAQPLRQPSAPGIAIPTTAGTGSEVTRNAVLASPAHAVKVSLRSPHMLPRVALIDPLLTHSLPPAVTAASGLDALTQLIEPYVSCRANPLIEALCVDGIRRAAGALPRAVRNGGDAEARSDMALASLLSGLALANAGLGAVHGFAGPIGGMFPAPHGAVCAALLPHVMAVNIAALRARAASSATLGRYDEIARLVTGNAQATADDGVAWIGELVQTLQIPRLRAYGMTPADEARVIDASAKASSMKANPLPLARSELGEIFTRAL